MNGSVREKKELKCAMGCMNVKIIWTRERDRKEKKKIACV
jgi:hypothetical protein